MWRAFGMAMQGGQGLLRSGKNFDKSAWALAVALQLVFLAFKPFEL